MENFIDEKEKIHYTKTLLGKDNQGSLYTTANSTIVLRNSSGRDIDKKIYPEISFMPLDEIKNIILPMCFLKEPAIGYVMEIPDNFVPLTEENYAETEVKYRLKILMNLAKILNKLHQIPVMYGSISPLRILIPEDEIGTEVYLLYSTGISCTVNLNTSENTDPYIAPETNADILSDAYVFCKLAQDLLTDKEVFVAPPDVEAVIEKALKSSPLERPRMSEIHETLKRAIEESVNCAKCNWLYHYEEKACPKCNVLRSKIIKAQIYDRISHTNIPKFTEIFDLDTESKFFFNYHIKDKHEKENEPFIVFAFNVTKGKKPRFVFKNVSDREIEINSKVVIPGQAVVTELVNTIEIRVKDEEQTRCIDISIAGA